MNSSSLFLAFFAVECFFVPILLVEVQLDAVIEVGFLEHLAQVAGAHLVGKRLLFKIVQVVFFALAAMAMRNRLELLFFDNLFLN